MELRSDSWTPLQPGAIKVNVDVALPSNTEVFRVSGVAHNERGQCIWWYRKELPGRPPPTDGEAIAMLHGVREALHRGHRRIVVETDCFPIYSHLSSCSSSFSS